MAFQRTLHKVPDSEVDDVVADFESEGAIVMKIKDGATWTVIATFP